MIVKGPEEIEFFTRFEPPRKGPPLYFRNKEDALAFLRRISMHSGDRSILRSLLSKVEDSFRIGRLNDQEILDLLANHLVSGRIWAVRVHLFRRGRSAKAAPKKEYMTPLEVSRMEREARPPVPPEKRETVIEPLPPRTTEPAVSPEIAAAQAETVKQAAQSGAPFCEE
jgi:hypothetical protein